MANKDERIDAYLENARDFAKPILRFIRTAVHKANSHVTETIKWGMPHFEYGGKILCGMASFKEHCALNFRLASQMEDPHKLMQKRGEKTGMGNFGAIRSTKDLPSQAILIQYIREAIALTDEGVGVPGRKTPARREMKVPDDFAVLLKKDKTAWKNFTGFSYSRQKDYLEWITSAKTPQTRERRMATAVQWLHEGKGLNWKYEK